MTKIRYETGSAPHITVAECGGDISVKGWTESGVLVTGDHERVDTPEKESALTIRASGSIRVWVPSQASLLLQDIKGDANVKGLSGSVHIASAQGDLLLKSSGSARVEVVYGDLSARNVDGGLDLGKVMGDVALRGVGDLTVGAVHGDLAARYVEGDVTVKEGMGDISLRTVNGNVSVESCYRDVNLNNMGGKVLIQNALGDIRLKGGLVPGKHNLNAQGDIVVRWPVDAPLNLLVSAGQVESRLNLEDVAKEEGTFSGRLGDGDTTLVLSAKGRVILKEVDEAQWESDIESDWAGFGVEFAQMGADLAGMGEQISGEINARMAELTARMDKKFGPEFAQKMADKAANKTERAVRRAMREVDRARKRAEGWSPPPPPASPKPKTATKASADEQMKILGMLEKGIISVEEAETLLKALE